MRGQVSSRGDASIDFWAALAPKDTISDWLRQLFFEELVAMDRGIVLIENLCTPIEGRVGLFAYDSRQNGMEERAARPWAALMRKHGEVLLLHVVPEFTGGRAELAAAHSEAIARFDLE